MVDADSIIAGPAEAVLSSGKGGGTGGLQTSTLAIGLAQAAVGFVNQEAAARPDLQGTGHALKLELEDLRASLLALADGDAHVAIHANAQDLRAAANSFVLRATQAALVAAKGAGYVQGHPVERWCREAMFFLVWSCPQPVLDANLCEFAGLGA
jgi:alkylation response protein AidB-like acyl-CoA dehydrogenase